jgi:hypothetical protein
MAILAREDELSILVQRGLSNVVQVNGQTITLRSRYFSKCLYSMNGGCAISSLRSMNLDSRLARLGT